MRQWLARFWTRVCEWGSYVEALRSSHASTHALIDITVNRLKDIEIELLRTLLAHLHRAVEDDTMVDFRELERASNRGRVQVHVAGVWTE